MKNVKQQLLPIPLTIVTFICLSFLLAIFIQLLNHFPVKQKIIVSIRPIDMLVGMTIYAKTSLDFTLFMGNLMHTNPGWKKRIAIEIGTALGNGLGTFIVLVIWFFFKEAPHLMVAMMILASLILFQMAEESLEDSIKNDKLLFGQKILLSVFNTLKRTNVFFRPFLSKLIPETGITTTKKLPIKQLLFFSLTVPFILGLDDFAGYIPLFNIINVFSFTLGVFLAHMLLNIGLFAFPDKTTRLTRHPYIILAGSFVFIGLGAVGIYEAAHIAYMQILGH